MQSSSRGSSPSCSLEKKKKMDAALQQTIGKRLIIKKHELQFLATRKHASLLLRSFVLHHSDDPATHVSIGCRP